MKATELVKRLMDLIAEHGDQEMTMEVCAGHIDDSEMLPIESVSYGGNGFEVSEHK